MQPVVVKCGGAVAESAADLILELAYEEPVVVVHGAGPQISAEMDRRGLEVRQSGPGLPCNSGTREPPPWPATTAPRKANRPGEDIFQRSHSRPRRGAGWLRWYSLRPVGGEGCERRGRREFREPLRFGWTKNAFPKSWRLVGAGESLTCLLSSRSHARGGDSCEDFSRRSGEHSRNRHRKIPKPEPPSTEPLKPPPRRTPPSNSSARVSSSTRS